MIKTFIKRVLPPSFLSGYHWCLAKLAAFVYKYPSEKLIIIGVTGTNGKTTTVNLISQLLECLDFKTGLTSTVNFKIGKKEWLNDKKMTMLGRFKTQKLLRQMVQQECKYIVIETSSQGIEQFRHLGINYDVVVFTNLTPEHIEAHGNFENYRDAKEKLFSHLIKSKRKKINNREIKKIIISNADDQETIRLKNFKTDKFFTYGFQNSADYQGQDLKLENGLVSFSLRDQLIKSTFLGKFNGYNLLASLVVIDALSLDFKKAMKCKLKGVPGRQEFIDCDQNFKVLIDYAPEPASLQNLYKSLQDLKYNKLIHVFGSCGGGRDQARQPILGKLVGEFADIAIVTNEDPYDDDPNKIINNVAGGAKEAGKELDKDLFKILDRKKAIQKALNLAQTNDLVLITGKGAEQAICVANGKKILHDDRQVVRDFLKQ